MSSITRPNLFDFATSELSQDASLCWLAALVDHDDPTLQQLGRAFVAWLWKRATGADAELNDIQLVRPPRQQWHKIDITLDLVIAGEKARIIIEDKTETSHHSRQLERYLEVAAEPGIRVVPIYFKTGYHFGSDRAASKAGYVVVGLSEWVGFLNAQTARNDIFEDYRAYVTDLALKREQALALLSAPLGFQAFGHDYVQYEFIGKLANCCPETIGGAAINRGINMGGAPWTHYRFVRLPGVLAGGIDEVVFHRIDKRQDADEKSRYYLSTRQYAPVKGNADAVAAKLIRLKAYRATFSQAAQAVGLVFAAPANDFRGANESEIGLLFFDPESNSTTNVLERFPALHRLFVQSLGALDTV